MKEYSFIAKSYILSILTVGVVSCFAQVPSLGEARLLLLLIAIGLTTITQIVQVEGIIQDSSYSASLFGYSLTLLALGRVEAIWVALVSFLTAWIWKKGVTPWFALGFNIGSVSISITLADLAWQLITRGSGFHGLRGFIGMIATGGIYIYLSQFINGLLYLLIDGTTFRESGHLTGLLIATDATQFAMGHLRQWSGRATRMQSCSHLVPFILFT
jgi:hypothetical protein